MRTVITINQALAGLTVEVAPLFPWPDDPLVWLRGLLTDSDEQARIVAAEDTTTDLGWPLTLFALDVGGEPRVLALYKFLEWGGAVQVLGALDEPTHAAVVAALLEARPDFTTEEAICLADLLPPAEVRP